MNTTLVEDIGNNRSAGCLCCNLFCTLSSFPFKLGQNVHIRCKPDQRFWFHTQLSKAKIFTHKGITSAVRRDITNQHTVSGVRSPYKARATFRLVSFRGFIPIFRIASLSFLNEGSFVPPGEGVPPYNCLYGESLAERDTTFNLQVYEKGQGFTS